MSGSAADVTAIPLLFDLDGTITDSRRGIVRCIAHALEQLGRVAPPDGEMTCYVGPPLAASFQALLATSDAALVEQAIAAYRDRYERLGLFENDDPGVRQALDELTSAGHRLSVVTAKPRFYATRVLDAAQPDQFVDTPRALVDLVRSFSAL